MAPRLLRPDLVALREEPGPCDDEQIGVAADRGRKGGVGRGHAHDAESGGVQYLEARRAVELDPVNPAVRTNAHRQPPVAVQLAARPPRGGHRADALELSAPF